MTSAMRFTLSSVAAAPPMSRRGDSAIWAFFTAVTVLVRPDHRTKHISIHIRRLGCDLTILDSSHVFVRPDQRNCKGLIKV